MREAIEQAMAELVSQFTPEARARKLAIAKRAGELAKETMCISLDELQRLLDAGRSDLHQTFHSFLAARTQLAREGISSPLNAGYVAVLLDAGRNVTDLYSESAAQRKAEIEGELFALAFEDLELSETELRRLALETPGAKGVEYAQASSLVASLRRELQSEDDLFNPKPASVLGNIIKTVKDAAVSEIRSFHRSN